MSPAATVGSRLTGWRARLAWTGALLAALFGVAAAVLLMRPGETPVVLVPVFVALGTTYGAVGALVATRQPRNPVGWLLLAAGLVLAVSVFASTYVTASLEGSGGTLPGTILLAWLSSFTFVPLLGIVLVVVPLVFPTGRPLSPRWGWVVALAVAGSTARAVHDAFAPGELASVSTISNPVGIPAIAALSPVLRLADPLMLLVAFPLALASLVIRFRRANATERAQLKWFASTAAVTTMFLMLSLTGLPVFSDIGWILAIVGVAAMPVSIGVALLRYRLYEIDRIISRTLGWAIVTGVLVGVFALLVVGLEALLAGATQGQTLAVAASTLAAFALFQPVRRRVQLAVDRRFDRARYDGELTVRALGSRLRDEVDLARIQDVVVTSATDAIRPRTIVVWLRDRQSP